LNIPGIRPFEMSKNIVRNRILIIFAHPAVQKSRVNSRLVAALNDLEGITFHNLYEEYPDFHIDIKREQELLLNHDIIVWHHPFYWYSAPSILKEWIDLVLEHGFAYGRTGKMLEGKQVMTCITTGGRREAYQTGGFNRFTIRQFLSPFEQTARLCNMQYLPPYVIHGSHLLDEEEIRIQSGLYKDALRSLRDGFFSENDLKEAEYLNDIVINLKSNLN
jgi:glutathione-regulated potassium-efflux system ancillary protein KefG